MSALTPAQLALRRWGQPKDLPHTLPRNPTASERMAGAPPLSPAEWAALREWQRKALRKWTYDPMARAARAQIEREAATWPAIPDPAFDIATHEPAATLALPGERAAA